MNDIRVTYAGLVSLILGTINIPIGLAFMLIVTRTLSATEYGTWGLISGIIIYATVIEGIINYWSVREIARNQHSGKTSVFTGLLFSLIGIVIYLISAYFIGGKTDADQNIVLLGSILVPLIFLNRVLQTIALGWKPQGTEYSQLIFGIFQIPAGIVFVYFLGLGTAGIIYSVSVAYIVSIIYLLIFNKEKIKGTIEKKFVKKWLKFSWVSMYPAIGSVILFLDITVFSVITGSVIGLAFWTASMVITTVISSSGLISRAVYSKLLQGNNIEFIPDSLRQLFYFSILFTAIVITFSKPGLFALNPQYVNAEIIVIILAIQGILFLIAGNMQGFITGIDKTDINENATFKEFLKSKLFFMPTILLVQSVAYIISLTIVLLIMTPIVEEQIDLLLYWALTSLIVQIPISIYTIIIFRRNFLVRIDIKNIFKYLIAATIAFGAIHILMDSFLTYELEIVKFLPQVILFVIFGVTIYIIITFSIDNKTRNLVTSIIKEFKK